jgi:regulator of nonsense transcripts 2
MLNEETSLDQIDSFFRIRLVCVLLDTCGQYFDRGSTKKKLDCFLVYFQRYYLFKKEAATAAQQEHVATSGLKAVDPIIDIEFLYTETISSLRPGFKRAATYKDACEQVTKMENEVRESLNKALPANMLKSGDNTTDNTNLATIQEASDGENDELDDEDDEDRQRQQADNEEEAGRNEDDPEDEEDFDDEDEDDEEDEAEGDSKRLTRKSGDTQDSNSEDVDDFNVSASRVSKQSKVNDNEDDEFVKEFESLVIENIAVTK